MSASITNRCVVPGRCYTITFENGRLEFVRGTGAIMIRVSKHEVLVTYSDSQEGRFWFKSGRAKILIDLGLDEISLILQLQEED